MRSALPFLLPTLALLTTLAGAAAPERARPLVPPGPTAGDLGHGWPAELAARQPPTGAHVPWLRSATAARLFLARLPPDDAAARARLVEAMAMSLARHGRPFEERAWRSWFQAQPWYRESADWSPMRLSEGEREAMDLLVAAWERRLPAGPVRR